MGSRNSGLEGRGGKESLVIKAEAGDSQDWKQGRQRPDAQDPA